MQIEHDPERQRFVAPETPGAFLSYTRREAGPLDLQHTVVPPEHQDRGVGTALVEHALRYARDHDHRVVPTCAFVRAYLRDHPEQGDVVATA